MLTRQGSGRCYTCDDRGHRENRCPDNSKKGFGGGRLRHSQPAFELTVPGLRRVLVCDRDQLDYEVRAFGVEVTNDALRIMHQDEKIAFFGTPSRDREFALLLPNTEREIRINWNDQRLTIGSQYLVTDNMSRTWIAPPQAEAPDVEFAVTGVGDTVYEMKLDVHNNGNSGNYQIYIDGRRQVAVVPTFVSDHVKLWIENQARREYEARAASIAQEVGLVVDDIIDGVAAIQVEETPADES